MGCVFVDRTTYGRHTVKENHFFLISRVRITFNVNHTVDTEDFGEDTQPEKQEFSEMRSKPQFEVDLVRGDTTLGFTCSFLQDPPSTNADEYSESMKVFIALKGL